MIEVLGRKPAAGDGVVPMGVKARADEDQVGLELIDGLIDAPPDPMPLGWGDHPLDWQIHHIGEAVRGLFPRPGEDVGGVDRDELVGLGEAAAENLLCPVP